MTPTDNTIQQWEYHRIYVDTEDNVLERIHSAGERGWELVATIPSVVGTRYHWFFFKRPKTQHQ